MSLADEIRHLEALLQEGQISRSEFEASIAELSLKASATGDTSPTNRDRSSRPTGMTGGPTPTHIGAYELVELLGQGGMGAVYLAKHILKPGLFAVKVPRYELLTQPGFGHRFKREASVGLRLDHPGIVRVHDLVIDGYWAAIVMDFVAGPNLETLLRNQGGPLPLERALDLMVQTLDAMDYAHQQGVVHRDLKPKNLLVRPNGQLQVTDFGIARLMGTDDGHTGTTAGTAAYMAPELWAGSPDVDHRADVFALGMTLYKLLVGHQPFQQEVEGWRRLQAAQASPVPSPPPLAGPLPAPLLSVVQRAVAAQATDRFPSCADFREALLDAAGLDWKPRTAPPPAPPRAGEPKSSGGTQYAILAVLVALLLAVIWLGASMRDGPPAIAETTPAATPSPVPEAPPLEPTAATETPELAVVEAEPTPRPVEPRPSWTPPPSPAPTATPAPTPEPTALPATPEPTTPRPTPEPTPNAPPMGLLYLDCKPRCLVEIGARTYSSEQTSQGLIFAPGRYRVRFVCDDPVCDDYERRSGIKTLDVLADEETRYTADFVQLNSR